ncbi:ABC transporter ATP-binding protein [Pedobacter mendelii]|uniref:ABC transporter ATP-binding protein n=2 Tax=Pedobacter mendelii TaxID=1908240 RepID=A0ABQ2BD18_9SPHI|nr:ABC transporter ATP-binding protein [Pedobacter mendelii]
MAGLQRAAGFMGFKTLPVELTYERLQEKVALPCILHWEKGHYVVLFKLTSKKALIADPALDGLVWIKRADFLKSWQVADRTETGRALLLEVTPEFGQIPEAGDDQTTLWSLSPYLKGKQKALYPVLLSLLLASGFSLLVPLLTQLIVDKGIDGKNVNLLGLICLGQLLLFTGRMIMDYLRARWLFRIGALTSIAMLKNFLARLMRLPFNFFDNRQAGDNMQRVNDNQRVEDFLTTTLIGAVMSVVTVIVLGGVLWYYDWRIFILFFAGATFSLIWSNSFQQKRKVLDQKKFKVLSANQQLLLEIFHAMQEIKLTGSEEEKKAVWETLQDRSYNLKLESLQLDQLIQGVGSFANEVKNVLITYLAAVLVINGHLTLGGMLAVTYICGQLNAPVVQLIEFMRLSQNTRFILQRMEEVYREPEEDFNLNAVPLPPLPADIVICKLSFRYNPDTPFVLQNINMIIPAGKITAVVGMSGSGKTTLFKLLLKFYEASTGGINLGGIPFERLSAREWREHCGVVMQDGYVFMDTIANNICVGCATRDISRMYQAAELANMHEFFLNMPFGYETVVGKEGYGLSEGQKQRLLIARLIYRNPEFIFLDEATNSLDAHNELEIVENLNRFFREKTVLIVAHRLSTVRHADQIIVLHNGKLAETGTHDTLIAAKGSYYHLIKNQLELAK